MALYLLSSSSIKDSSAGLWQIRHFPLFLMFQMRYSFSAHLSVLDLPLQHLMRQGLRMTSQVPFSQMNSFIFQLKCFLVKLSRSSNSSMVILLVVYFQLLWLICYCSGAKGSLMTIYSMRLSRSSMGFFLLRVQRQVMQAPTRQTMMTAPPAMFAVDIPQDATAVAGCAANCVANYVANCVANYVADYVANYVADYVANSCSTVITFARSIVTAIPLAILPIFATPAKTYALLT